MPSGHRRRRWNADWLFCFVSLFIWFCLVSLPNHSLVGMRRCLRQREDTATSPLVAGSPRLPGRIPTARETEINLFCCELSLQKQRLSKSSLLITSTCQTPTLLFGAVPRCCRFGQYPVRPRALERLFGGRCPVVFVFYIRNEASDDDDSFLNE